MSDHPLTTLGDDVREALGDIATAAEDGSRVRVGRHLDRAYRALSEFEDGALQHAHDIREALGLAATDGWQGRLVEQVQALAQEHAEMRQRLEGPTLSPVDDWPRRGAIQVSKLLSPGLAQDDGWSNALGGVRYSRLLLEKLGKRLGVEGVEDLCLAVLGGSVLDAVHDLVKAHDAAQKREPSEPGEPYLLKVARKCMEDLEVGLDVDGHLTKGPAHHWPWLVGVALDRLKAQGDEGEPGQKASEAVGKLVQGLVERVDALEAAGDDADVEVRLLRTRVKAMSARLEVLEECVLDEDEDDGSTTPTLGPAHPASEEPGEEQSAVLVCGSWHGGLWFRVGGVWCKTRTAPANTPTFSWADIAGSWYPLPADVVEALTRD